MRNLTADAQRELWDVSGSIGEEAYVSECGPFVKVALEPCVEYKFGTDSAIQCTQRYVEPALKAAWLELCARHAEGEMREVCELQAAEASGNAVRIAKVLAAKKEKDIAARVRPRGLRQGEIGVSKEGVWFDRQLIVPDAQARKSEYLSLPDLLESLRSHAQTATNHAVTIRAEPEATFTVIKKAMFTAATAGLGNISLALEGDAPARRISSMKPGFEGSGDHAPHAEPLVLLLTDIDWKLSQGKKELSRGQFRGDWAAFDKLLASAISDANQKGRVLTIRVEDSVGAQQILRILEACDKAGVPDFVLAAAMG